MADRSERYMAGRSEGSPFSTLAFASIPGLVSSPDLAAALCHWPVGGPWDLGPLGPGALSHVGF